MNCECDTNKTETTLTDLTIVDSQGSELHDSITINDENPSKNELYDVSTIFNSFDSHNDTAYNDITQNENVHADSNSSMRAQNLLNLGLSGKGLKIGHI